MPVGFFECTFLLKKESAYRKAFSFRSGMSQHSALLHSCGEDQYIMGDVNTREYQLFIHNPLKQGLYLDTITVGRGRNSLLAILIDIFAVQQMSSGLLNH